MTSRSIPFVSIKRLLSMALAAGLLSALAWVSASTAQTQGSTPPGAVAIPRPPATNETVAATHPTEEDYQNWHRQLMKAPRPAGCFTATYPDVKWVSVPCKEPPHTLYPPSRGPNVSLEQVGNGPDFSAVAPSGHILEAEGSFDPATSVTSECDVPCPIDATGQIVCPANPSCTGNPSNSYSLQLNTKPFSTSACNASPNKNAAPPETCQGWEQFVYNSGGSGTIQYWLEHYGPAGTACPAPISAACQNGAQNVVQTDGWCPFSFTSTSDIYCVVNAPGSGASPPPVPASQLTSLHMEAAAAGFQGNASDSMVMTVTGNPQPFGASGKNYFPDLGSQLSEFEFNVFGAGNGSQAVFNSGAVVAVRSGMDYGGSAGPTCDLQSFTGESNNLTLNTVAPAAVAGALPALLFTEVNPAPSSGTASCVDATSVGDTHLYTYNGLAYDFQASGDFVLSEAGSDFVVQNRQVSGAPTWPNAAVNHGVATRMGKTSVAVCIAPTADDRAPAGLFIDGQATALAGGQTISAPGQVQVSRTGDLYTVTDASGNSLRAQVNAIPGGTRWINASVGLGRWPAAPHGLLSNANSDVNQIAARTGEVLTRPFAFSDLYGLYGESWRVQAGESLLAVCGERTESANPTAPFYAGDLPAALRQRGQAACTAAGVKPGPLLENCILDVAVIGGDAAATVFAGARDPVAVGSIGAAGGDHMGTGGGGARAGRWILPLLLLAALVWFVRRLV